MGAFLGGDSLQRMNHREEFQQINQAISDSSNDFPWSYGQAPFPTWYGFAVADIALLIGDGTAIAFMDSLVEPNGADEPNVTIRVFTADLLVTVRTTSSTDGTTRQTSARSRRGMSAIQVTSGTSALSNAWPDDWPGAVRVSLEYDDGEKVTLPASDASTSAQHERLAAFLPSLRADLARPLV